MATLQGLLVTELPKTTGSLAQDLELAPAGRDPTKIKNEK